MRYAQIKSGAKLHLVYEPGEGYGSASVVRAGARGRYFNTIDLVTRLEEEARIGRPARLPRSAIRPGLPA
mgnify:CR=1 FL=1